ncbi:MAG: peptidoglycan-binding domain-containing protein [Henriciella sp.]|nr:peptidoglycan-binding domain-containing protein [Henriciella sp.]
MNKYLIATVSATTLAGVAFGQAADMPPTANPGECFARVLIPETTQVVTEQVIDREASFEINVIPAAYETVTEQRLVKEGTTVFKTIPAVYDTVTEVIEVEPAREEKIVVPAQYETYTEQVLIREAYTTWKPGAGLFGRGDAGVIPASGVAANGDAVATGELLCMVEVPAQYDTVTRTRLISPERTDIQIIPAVTKTVEKQVVVTPPQVVEETIPAEYETVTLQQLVTPAYEERIEIPATYKTVEKRVVTGGGGLEWREVLCDTNTTSAKISEIQTALTAAGYTVPADGEFGPATLNAMESYQRANGLPVGYLTVSTVESLGVSPF